MTPTTFSSCCFKGVKHEGTATGSIETLEDFEIYVKRPANQSPDKAVLVLTDVFGHNVINAQLIADQFAANGYLVMMPDLFYGDVAPQNFTNFDAKKWFEGHYSSRKEPHKEPQVDPIVQRCIKELRNKYGIKRIAGVGYCFGAKYVIRHLRQNKESIDVGYFAHPGPLGDDELEAMDGPLAIALAENDVYFSDEMRLRTEEFLKKKELPYQCNLYGGVEHGFASRGDPNIRTVQYARENAFLLALQFFEQWL